MLSFYALITLRVRLQNRLGLLPILKKEDAILQTGILSAYLK